MRLLEPLSGMKAAQGHALLHLVFFITMWSVDIDMKPTNLFKKPAPPAAPAAPKVPAVKSPK